MATEYSTLQLPVPTKPDEAAPALSHHEDDSEWVATLRESMNDHIREYERRRSLRETLFPLSRGHVLTWMDVLQAEALWAVLLLSLGFVAFAVVRAGVSPTLHYGMNLLLFSSPVLVVWTLVGAYYIRRQGRR